MLTNMEIFKIVNKELKDKYIDGNLFKDTLSSLDPGSVIKKMKGFEYTYGYKENIGEFFILVREDLEGFIYWSRTNKVNGHYELEVNFFMTKEFKKIFAYKGSNFFKYIF